MLNDEDKERLYKELDHVQKAIQYMGNSIWVVNSILITGSLLVAFQMKSEILPTPIASLVLMLTSIILTATTNKINRIWYKRLERIREELGMSMPTRIYESQIEGKWWYSLRVNAIYFLYSSLISMYLYLIFQKPFLPLITFLVGIAAIAAREVRAYIKRETRKSK